MDASGKDGTTRRVFGACSPAGINVVAFKKPSEEEFAHDFLWRIHQHAPAKGMVQVFNRSHYEDVLIQRVHKWISEEHAKKRLESINAFEELLEYDNNTRVLKFYLHISREKQKEELLERLEEPHKNWKHNPNDLKEA
jgi:polyphosphate kinase 2 (PPK2 family)